MSCLILCEVTYFLVSTNARRPNVKVRRVVSIEDRGASKLQKNCGVRLASGYPACIIKIHIVYKMKMKYLPRTFTKM